MSLALGKKGTSPHFLPWGCGGQIGALRSDGVSERAVFIIDKPEIIRYIDVHGINKRPHLEDLARELEKLS